MEKLKLALIGRDVSKSESGSIHRFILESKGVKCEYENVSVSREEFPLQAARLLKETDGFNVTIPYKRDVFGFLREVKGDAAEADSVNTVVTATGTGYNTDGAGFVRMMSAAGMDADGKTVLILGGGGSGRSTAAALKKAGARVFVYQRRRDALEEICLRLGVAALETPEGFPCDILINCTGVGMHESEGLSPVGRETIENCGAAVDLIYRPAESEFLRLARECGKKTLNGGAMLFYQAYYSDCIYLGERADGGEAEGLYVEYSAFRKSKKDGAGI